MHMINETMSDSGENENISYIGSSLIIAIYHFRYLIYKAKVKYCSCLFAFCKPLIYKEYQLITTYPIYIVGGGGGGGGDGRGVGGD